MICSTTESIDAIIISATPETTHFPMAKESLQAGKLFFSKSRSRSNFPKPMS